ncbi:unnamed protein product [Timema podura]|uniref:Large ribosomal subunit protein uL10m n=1 Tax=Timema podura TaxID=61482 RepID=A0ABN7PAC0_TIMPD|nr:unnamed protein product [Timema podura]
MHLKIYGRNTLKMAVENTRYEVVLKLFESHNLVVFSAEPQVGKLLKLLKKIPQLTLLVHYQIFIYLTYQQWGNSGYIPGISPLPYQGTKAKNVVHKDGFAYIAGIVDGQFLNKNDLVRYSALPDLQTSRAGLVTVLNSMPAQIVHNLNHHQQTLVGHLQQHLAIQQKPQDGADVT